MLGNVITQRDPCAISEPFLKLRVFAFKTL
jgi:hypothetical protein